MRRETFIKGAMAFCTAVILLLCFAWFLPAQVTQVSGLAVAQSSTKWNRLKDMAQGDAQTSGIAYYAPCLWNGSSCDRQRGSIANGAEVNLKNVSGGTTPADAFANPTNALTMWGLMGIFNGTTWDRWQEADTDGVAVTGIPGTGTMLFRENDNTFTRSRGQSTPVQVPINANSLETGAADTAVVKTIATDATQRGHIYKIAARCSAGTSGITITDGGTTVWSTAAAEVTTVNKEIAWNPGLTSLSAGNDFVITLATCGGGNTGTLMVQGDRFIH